MRSNVWNNHIIHLQFSLPWLLSLWVSAFLFLPLEGSDCFFSGVYEEQKQCDPTTALFTYITAIALWDKLKSYSTQYLKTKFAISDKMLHSFMIPIFHHFTKFLNTFVLKALFSNTANIIIIHVSNLSLKAFQVCFSSKNFTWVPSNISFLQKSQNVYFGEEPLEVACDL